MCVVPCTGAWATYIWLWSPKAKWLTFLSKHQLLVALQFG